MPGKRSTTKIWTNGVLLLFSTLTMGCSSLILLKRWDLLTMYFILFAWLACPRIIENKTVLRIVRGTFIVLGTTIIVWRDEIFG